MDDYIENEKLIQDLQMMMKIPELRAALFHKLEEYKISHAKSIGEYRELENMVDPGTKTENKEASVEEIRFEIRKKKAEWSVNPVDIPLEVVNHIISHGINPGIIKMQKFTLADGRTIDLSFEMQSRGCITGSIIEKSTKKAKKENPFTSNQSRKTDDKTENIKTLMIYLLNNEDFFRWVVNEFFETWKPLIDKGCIPNER